MTGETIEFFWSVGVFKVFSVLKVYNASRVIIDVESAYLAIVASVILPLQDGIAVAGSRVLIPRRTPFACHVAELHVAQTAFFKLPIDKHVGERIGVGEDVEVGGYAKRSSRTCRGSGLHLWVPGNDVGVEAAGGGIGGRCALAASHDAARDGR